jgi:hypothetical protein
VGVCGSGFVFRSFAKFNQESCPEAFELLTDPDSIGTDDADIRDWAMLVRKELEDLHLQHNFIPSLSSNGNVMFGQAPLP